MPTCSAANQGTEAPWEARGAAGWLALAPAPTFALMSWISGHDSPPITFCSSGSSGLPIGGMPAMYLLMSMFHLPPWLKLACGRRWART
jgi:hypothetical protein